VHEPAADTTVAERRRVRGLLQNAGVAVLLTLDDRGIQAGRPMLPLWLDEDPHLYFLTHQGSRKVSQIAERPDVALTMTAGHSYFVVLGSASTSRDPELIRRLWRPSYRAWFPGGKDDREAVALRVAIRAVHYWEPTRAPFSRAFQAIKAILTRRPVDTPMKTIDGW
jgi:general stress protein 26